MLLTLDIEMSPGFVLWVLLLVRILPVFIEENSFISIACLINLFVPASVENCALCDNKDGGLSEELDALNRSRLSSPFSYWDMITFLEFDLASTKSHALSTSI